MNPTKVKRAMLRLRKKVENSCHRNELPFSSNKLAGACGICSFLTFRMLKRMGLRPVFHISKAHAFVTVQLDKKYWVDLTLTQFDPMADPVFFSTHSHRGTHSWAHRDVHRRASSVRAIRPLFTKWPDEQNPFKQKLPKFFI